MHDIAHAAADAARVPDFDDVLTRGRRQRTRRQGLVVGAAAVAVATIVGVTQVVGGGAGDNAPQPAPSIPTEVPSGSAATNIPYWSDGTLHVGDAEVRTEFMPGLYAAGTTIVGDRLQNGGSEFRLVEGTDLVPIAKSDELMLGTLSRDGRLLVTLELESEEQRLIAWDVESRTEVGAVSLPTDPSSPFLVVGIDLDHRVFVADRRTALMWVPGDDPIPVTGVDASDLGAEPWPGGLSHSRIKGDRGNRGITTSLGDAFGTVDDSGRFHEVGRLSSGGPGTWSPTGAVHVSYLPTDATAGLDVKALTLEYADGREPAVIRLPDDELWLPVTWESDTQLVLYVPGDQPDSEVNPHVAELVRCDLVALDCTPIEDVPDGGIYWPADAPRR